ncbi:uncharacterized protein LOC111832123 [Capsella rubella]|uniref:uncharacterized protein LOC111832123 n=1 Tax=Capsella rubella TaxID=81985 RepID=UPI000CD4DC66|nr:uncharacterized protein LOC111832123 [Capsella rubella]
MVNEIPLYHTDHDSPMLKRCVKRMVQNDVSPEEGALLARHMGAIFLKQTPLSKKEKKKKVFVSEKVSAMIQNRIPEKLPDPGSFVLDCSIFTERFPHSLCDLGSGINLIPYSVAVRLGMTDFKPTRISLILADRSKRIPEGLLEDVLIRIGECIIPTDFVVLKYSEEPQDPLILGRSFLATAGALIDVQKGTIGLYVEEAIDDKAVVEYSRDIIASNHLFRTRDHNGGLANYKLLEDDVFVLEMRIAESNCRKSGETRAAGSVSSDNTMVSVDTPRHDSTNLPRTDVFRVDLTAANLSPVLNRKASPPILQRPREKQRDACSLPKPSHIIDKTFKGTKTVLQLTKPQDYRRALVGSFDDVAGKRSVPPTPQSCPAAAPRVVGRSPTPNAYKPPWMMRHYSRRHLVPLPDPPDA